MDRLLIIKIGGNVVDDELKLKAFLQTFASISYKKILVHGGGKLATRLAETLGIEQKLIDGRRVTDAETLKVVTMVYAGLINKNIVAALQSNGCGAIGLTGADGDVIRAHKRVKAGTDFGFAGDIDAVGVELIENLLKSNAIVFAPITHDKKGQLLNTNADTIAQELATALSARYAVTLIYSFEKPGVLLDAEDDNTVITSIDPSYYTELRDKKLIFAGMIPKLDNAFSALDKGVEKVVIGKAENLSELINGAAGTTIIKAKSV